ncbi:MAG: type 4a pilus biogenesis protein PilO [Gammaproteobacteria bacterium]|nr:type 4a pilus biogenesis protein PilO [Gammaproteobacteria bacterium]MYF28144.1 type 4a pilus biogenesis protein PilO [Gammaproteobacteria bacterium]MYK47245.1 type 4a pilus biogenesis protein PilO [Gammaproteobacteria bacterium]
MNAARSVDLTDLDIAEIGAWPTPVKGLCVVILAAVVLALGYLVAIADKRSEFALAEQREVDLRHQFKDRARTAAGLSAHRIGLAEATAALGETLGRLPVDTEVPGLVEDINRAADDHDLAIARIELRPERQAEFYRELPITIDVAGDYHDLGAFAGDIAGLSRLVTLHDFDLAPRTGPRDLGLTIEARTYRYNETPATPRPGGATPDGALKEPRT